ncbi:hypothetical protein [Cryptosporangium aurantiacum]|uniref:Uncharacterized protein n=1 Tax=Cryptosporangium aurantiacum TaxID=134849 RepID=A0A1M7RM38_9ACTN|nr:hypothetical protein [Cryptosporangium aurantiacum]SHN47395.1 hypothetical protein SAMN05443668_12341 [Cryptosporangium aurantiacum]
MTDTPTSGPQLLRPLLWVLLTIGMIGNAAASLFGDALALHLGFGALTAVSGIALAAQYLRRH